MKSATNVVGLVRFPGLGGVRAIGSAVRRFSRQVSHRWVLLRDAEVPPAEDSYAERRFESALKGPR